ncbi:MAG TPA: peptidylprolyl isomerase [Candidatus Limnocylindria bacterium]|nr:peptidylprolyl isomerase [Candidatus Limnocylindria bacterium]
MSFRNRPVLDRKHRPRWQDELRTQQLIVASFALAIAVAVGIFAAAAWSGFYQSNLRQAALVDDTPIQRAAIVKRIQMVAAELQATAVDLQGHAGGMRDQIIQQQLQTIDTTLGNVQGVGSDSLLTGFLLDRRAAALGVGPTDEEVQAEIDRRRLNATRLQLSLISAIPEQDEDAEPGDEPTDQQWADAKAEIDAIKDELDGGGDFETLAEQRSDDPSKALKGLLGWVERTDGQYGEYFKAAAKAEAGDVIGPIKNETGWYLLKVDDRQAGGRDTILDDFLAAVGVSEEEYRDYIRQEVLRGDFQQYFKDTVISRYQPQREVAQIFLNLDQGQPVPKLRVRHLLVQPIPGAQDQAEATAAQWRAARQEAEKLRREAVQQKDGQWWELAAQSDDTGSGARGGYLGWYDPATLAQQFVPKFATAANDLRIGEISPLVRTQFGYHVIQVTERRTSALELADRLAAQVQQDPASFADVAEAESEDVSSAQEGGELGWVVHYQNDAARDEAIFGLTEPGEISDPVVTGSGIYIYKLLDSADQRYVPQQQRDQVATSGFNRWLDEMREEAGVWVDSEFNTAGAGAAG